jgi:hypothetical protein
MKDELRKISLFGFSQRQPFGGYSKARCISRDAGLSSRSARLSPSPALR